MNLSKPVLLLSTGLLSGSWAQEALSTNVDGQPQMSGGPYTVDVAFDPTGQAASQAGTGVVVAKSGYAGQITDPRTLEVSVPDIDEGATSTASVTATLDDGTTSPVPPDSLAWEVVDGPIVAASFTSFIRAGRVFGDAAASIRGTWFGVSSAAVFTVRNINPDDIEPVAGDGIDDAWQFLYFDSDADGDLAGGEAGAAQPGSDPDGDGQNNLFEYLADYAPDDRDSFLDIRIVGVAGGVVTIELSKVVARTTYTLVGSTDLGTGDPWAVIGSPISGTDQSEFQIQHPSTDRFFYGLRLAPAP